MVYILLITVSILLLLVAVYVYKRKNKNTVSFSDSFNKTDLPIITLYNDCYALNFLVDTGSTFSCIDKTLLKYLHYCETNAIREVISINGVSNSPVILMNINDGEDCIKELFTVVDMTNSNSANDCITIHGILGAPFCRNAKWVIDFNKCEIRA